MNQITIDRNSRSRTPRSSIGTQDEASQPEKAGLAWPVRLLLVSLFLPWLWQIGPIALSPYRLALLITLIPALVRWMTGKAGQVRGADITILLYCFWCALALTVNHGLGVSLQPSGILFIETAGGYFVARSYIRDADSFYRVIRMLFWIIALMLPWAIMEAVTKRPVMLQFFSMFSAVHPTISNELRWGLRRVQGVVEHPILFGVLCGSILAMTHCVLGFGESAGKRWMRTLTVLLTAFTCLSAGPMTALIGQISLLFYHWLLRGFAYPWRLLCSGVACLWILASLFSNRSLPNIFLTEFSFDRDSAYFRLLIWTFGSQSALDHPLFGVGFNRWARPSWMPPSIDMFWLYHAVFYGIPAAALMLSTFLFAVVGVGFKRSTDAKLAQYKLGYLVGMCGFFLVGWTVHFWNGTYVLFLFLLGSGLWILDADPKAAQSTDAPSRAPVPSSRQTTRLTGQARREPIEGSRHRSK